MPVQNSDIMFFQSELEGSSGGAISPILVPQGIVELIFGDTPLDGLENGATEYRKVFLVNGNQTDSLSLAHIWTLLPPTSGEQIAMAVGTDVDTDPSALTFAQFTDENNSLALGTVGTTPVPIWIRRLTPAGLPPFQNRSMFQLGFRGTDQAVNPPVDATAILTFGWDLEQITEGNSMSQLNYILKVQGVDDNNLITTQAEVDMSIVLSADVIGDNTIKIPAGSVDMPINIMNQPAGADIIIAIPSQVLTVKYQSTLGTPFPLNPASGNVLDTKGITAMFVSNAGTDATLRVIQAVR
jgi:hypothetical protein